jgi:uncharacterized protein YukE
VSESWVGGDIAGLQTIGATMAPAREKIEDVVRALSTKVDSLSDDAGWSGVAAEVFKGVWAENALQAGGLAEVVVSVGSTLGGLGDTLRKIEDALYDAATKAQARGAQIGALGVPDTLVVTGNPQAPDVVAARQAQADYAAAYATAMHVAQGYRLQAADALSTIAEQVEPGEGLKRADALTVADYLRGLYAIPNEGNLRTRATAPDAINKAHDELKESRTEYRAARDAYAAEGLKLPALDPAAVAHSVPLQAIKELSNDLAAAAAGLGEQPFSRALNTKLGGLAELLPDARFALPEGLGFLRDIPVVDVVASGLIAELQTHDDVEKGWSSTEAREKDYAAAAIGLVGGVAATTAGAAGLAAMGVSAPVWLVAAGGGLVVAAASDTAYQAFHEHWSEDIHDDGVVKGLLVGGAHVGENVGTDAKNLGVGIGHAASSIWHGIFG